MIRSIVKEGEKNGFTTIDVFQEKIHKEEFEYFTDYNAQHTSRADTISVRAFWDQGDPVGFIVSSPDHRTIQEGFKNIYNSGVPGQKENIRNLLPSSVKTIPVSICDPAIAAIRLETFEDLIDRIKEAMITFPGLRLKKAHLSKSMKKIYLGNSHLLNVKYKKTIFHLQLSIDLNGTQIDISDHRIFFSQIDPTRMISRAHNLLNSITSRKKKPRRFQYLMLSPEASTIILNEFSAYLKGHRQMPKDKLQFPSILSIVDNPMMDGETGSTPFDDEGIQSDEKYLINKGNYIQPVTDIQAAFDQGSSSTGNGYRNSHSPYPRPRFSNMTIKPSVLSLKNLMRDAGKGVLATLIRLKYIENNWYYFSAYGYTFSDEGLLDPVHFYFRTSFLSYFSKILKVSKEPRFFYNQSNIGSPYVLCEISSHQPDIVHV